MSKTRKFLWGLAAVLFIAAIVLIVHPFVRVLALTDPDYVAIEGTLRTYVEIEAEANYTLDDSRLVEVLANDHRGGLYGDAQLNNRLLKSVQWFKGNPNLPICQTGFLDMRQAIYAFRRQGKQMYDNAIASGRLKPPRNRPDVDLTAAATGLLETLPEYKAMLKAAGYDGMMLPSPRPDKIVPPPVTIESIRVVFDLAYAKGHYLGSRVDFVFSRINGRWYLIGEHFLDPGG